jgi:Cu/Zn superoxide dismutase
MLCAEANFYKPGSNKIRGSVVFTQTNDKFVRVDIDLFDVPSGIHGIHVHENPIKFFKDMDYCQQAGGHFNGHVKSWSPKTPEGTPHGSFGFKTERHVGDMCNNIMSVSGVIKMTYYDNLISLIPDHPHCILGRSVVIHNEQDDEGLYILRKDTKKEMKRWIESRITGNAGKRIACANIILLENCMKYNKS